MVHIAVMQVQSTVDVDQPLFQPFPPELLFHSYEAFKEYEAVLRLRNNDKVGGAKKVDNCSLVRLTTPPAMSQSRMYMKAAYAACMSLKHEWQACSTQVQTSAPFNQAVLAWWHWMAHLSAGGQACVD